MPFPETIRKRAWIRQGGRCAYCGRTLVYANRDRGSRGAWHPHHRKPEVYEGTDTLHNCVIFCINPPNCHLNIGHGGVWGNYCPLDDSDLPYLYYGKKLILRRRLLKKRRTLRRHRRY